MLKWFIDFIPDGFSLFAGKPHRADIWYWKAHRTIPLDFADDKNQSLTVKPEKRATKITSADGTELFLLRQGDEGLAAYTSVLVVDRKENIMPRFEHTIPRGSRADVKAKGIWRDGLWTIEFQRALDTSHDDDIPFDPSKSYTLGLSRYEIAGRSEDPNPDQPLFGTGDIHQPVILSFEP